MKVQNSYKTPTFTPNFLPLPFLAHFNPSGFGGSVVGSPQIWVWPQLVFGRSPPIPHCNWRTLPSSQPLPSPPSPSLLPLGSFSKAPGGGNSGWWGARGPRAEGGGGGASNRHLGPDPHLGVVDVVGPERHKTCDHGGDLEDKMASNDAFSSC